jgi:hypothetical protein
VTMKNAIFWDATPCGFCNNVSVKRIASIIRVTIIGELGTTLALTSNRSTLASCLGFWVMTLCSLTGK